MFYVLIYALLKMENVYKPYNAIFIVAVIKIYLELTVI